MSVSWYFWPFFIFYRFVGLPLLLSLFFTLGFWFSSKIRRGMKLRMEANHRQPPNWLGKKRPIWLHASSGEFEYAKSVLREIKQRAPLTPILVTYFSPTYQKNIANTPEVDWDEPLPLDTTAACRQFLRRFNPQVCLISRTDLWPEMLYQCGKRNLPVYLFSATFSGKKARGIFSRLLARLLLPLVSEIFCVSEDDRSEILHLLPQASVTAAGDTRYDQVLFRLSHKKDLKEELKPADPLRTMVGGSTWPEDEKVLLPALAPFIKDHGLHLILAPHEPTTEHLKSLTSQLKDLGLTSCRYSEADHYPEGHVLIIDQVGILADLYSWGRMAFVGGSFKGSVHSVMEPLGSGAVTLVGPDHQNNREALEFKHKELGTNLHMVQVCVTRDEMARVIDLLLESRDQIPQWSERIVDGVANKSGASHAFVTALFTKTQLAPD